MNYHVIESGISSSFPDGYPFSDIEAPEGKAFIFVGADAGKAYVLQAAELDDALFVAVELGNECLGTYTGEAESGPANVLGFARFRLGDAKPSNLVELVQKSFTDPAALQAAKAAFEHAGLVVAVCNDFPGRIVNRLIRPYYNAALRRLDEGLATAADMDKTLRLGLGYPEGPIELLERTGLQHHYRVTQALYQALGQEAYAPARRAQVAWLREGIVEANDAAS